MIQSSNQFDRGRIVMADYIVCERKGNVGIITLNRPGCLNALSTPLMRELKAQLEEFQQDSDIRVVLLKGGEKAFAAGADIQEMVDKTFTSAYRDNYITEDWECVEHFRKPIIAVVRGFALGGGCEMAMACDMILASEKAKFGQPEINLGVPPGAGGTQRLTRAIGKAKAMDLCLTGRMIDAEEADKIGLISQLINDNQIDEHALMVANKIAANSSIATIMVKECINKSFECSLNEGLNFERRLFHASFSTLDQKEGMQAFLQKRTPKFN